MDKKNLVVLLVILIVLVILWGIFSLAGKVFIKPVEKPAGNINVPVLSPEAGQNLEQGRPSQVFKISSGEKTYPRFIKEAYFKPYEVSTGDSQIFYVWVEDPDGVATVKAEIETDLQTNNVDLKLVEGDNKEGRWEGSWHVCSVKNKDYYRIVFKAQSIKGQEANFTTFIKNLYYKK
jgi:hypothetical protein